MAGLQVKEGYAGLTASVSLAVAILKKCRANTWHELLAAMEAAEPFVAKTFSGLELTGDQLQTLDRFTPVLETISIKPVTVPAVCPECGLYVLLGTGTVPSKCLVTAGCTGKPVKPTAATASKDPVPAPETETEPDVPAKTGPEPVRDPAPAAPAAPADADDPDDFDLPGPAPAGPPVNTAAVYADDDPFA